MNEYLWANQPLRDLLYLTTEGSWVLGLVLLLVVPGLIGLVANSYLHSRTERVAAYISRFAPYSLYSFGVYLLNAVAGANVLMQVLARLGAIPSGASQQVVWGLYLALLAAVAGWVTFYRLSFRLWQYLYMPRGQAQLLLQDYFVIAQGRGLLMLPISLLLLSPIPTSVALPLVFALFALVQGARWLQALRRLWATGDAPVYIFLYLCAHELLPWCYLALGIGLLKQSEYIEHFVV